MVEFSPATREARVRFPAHAAHCPPFGAQPQSQDDPRHISPPAQPACQPTLRAGPEAKTQHSTATSQREAVTRSWHVTPPERAKLTPHTQRLYTDTRAADPPRLRCTCLPLPPHPTIRTFTRGSRFAFVSWFHLLNLKEAPAPPRPGPTHISLDLGPDRGSDP